MKKILIATKNKDKFKTIKQVLGKIAKKEYEYYSLYDIEGIQKDEKENGTIDKRAYCFMNKSGEYKSTIIEIPFKYKKYNGDLKIEENTYPLIHVLTTIDSDTPVSEISNEDDINYCLKYTIEKVKEIFQ